jgi:hypothetical protein
MFCNIHTLLTEFLSRHTFHMNKLAEVDFKIELLGQIRIGILISLRLRLGDQYTLYFQVLCLCGRHDRLEFG